MTVHSMYFDVILSYTELYYVILSHQIQLIFRAMEYLLLFFLLMEANKCIAN